MKKLLFLLFLILAYNCSFAQTKPADTTHKADTATVKNKVQNNTQQAANKDTANANRNKVDTASKKECDCIPLTPEQRLANWKEIGNTGVFLICIPIIIFIILLIVIISSLSKFPLKEALSENDIKKVTKINPEYDVDKLADLIKNAGANQAVVTNNLATLFPPTVEVSDNTVTEKNDQYTTSMLASVMAGSKDNPEIAKITSLPPTIELSKTNDDTDPKKKQSYRPSSSRLIAFISSMFALIIVLSMSCFFIYHYVYTGCPPQLSALTGVLVTLGIGVAPYGFNKIASAVSSKKDSNNA